MALRLFPAALLLSATLLGACLDEAPAPNQVSQSILVTDPGDRSQLGNGSAPHVHDYWGGQSRINLMEQERQSGGHISECGGWHWEVFRPDAPVTVYQGTASVDITMTWKDAPGDSYTDPELWVKTAADSQSAFVSDVTPGQTVTFQTNNSANDLPHNLLSAWEFHWVIHPALPRDPFCNQVFSGTISIKVDIVRGLDIPPYPGHPDRWDNKTQIDTVEATKSIFYYRGTKPPQSGMCLTGGKATDGCLWDPHRPANGTVIPYDTTLVEVTVTLRNTGPLDLGFGYHGADTRELVFLEPTNVDGAERTYEIPIKGAEGDGPYSLQSLWEFWLYPTHESSFYNGEYDIRVVALREAPT